MSTYLQALYNFPASFMQAMSFSVFTRLKNRFSTSPIKPESLQATPEEEANDRDVLEKAITQAVGCILLRTLTIL